MAFLDKVGRFSNIKADRWLKEGDEIKIGEITLNTLETPGHSPGSLCFFSDEVKEIRGQYIDGVIFTGDLLFFRDIGKHNIPGSDETMIYESIKSKIMYNPKLTDHFKILGGHMGYTTIGEERILNPIRHSFLLNLNNNNRKNSIYT